MVGILTFHWADDYGAMLQAYALKRQLELLGDRTQKLHFVIISAAVLVYVFVLIPLLGDLSREYGFVLASFIFLCVTIKLFNNISILKTVAISASSVLVIYVVFHYGLKVMMPT